MFNHGDIVKIIKPMPVYSTYYGQILGSLLEYPIGTLFIVDTIRKGIMLVHKNKVIPNEYGALRLEQEYYYHLSQYVELVHL